MLLKPAFSILSPAGRNARLSILIFHRVMSDPDPLMPDEPTITQFDHMMGWVKRWFNVLPLTEAVARMTAGQLPARAAAITFDDGYADNYTCALPVLKRHGLPATFYIATGFLGDGIMWNDVVIESIRHASVNNIDTAHLGLGMLELTSPATRRQSLNTVIRTIKHLEPSARADAVAFIRETCQPSALPKLMMQHGQLRALSNAGMEIGAHTVTHPILAKLGTDAARDEIARSRDELQQLLDRRISTFAYPNGKRDQDYHQGTVDIVKSLGFDAAVSTNWGYGHHDANRHELPRFSPWDRTRLRFGLRMLDNLRRPTAS